MLLLLFRQCLPFLCAGVRALWCPEVLAESARGRIGPVLKPGKFRPAPLPGTPSHCAPHLARCGVHDGLGRRELKKDVIPDSGRRPPCLVTSTLLWHLLAAEQPWDCAASQGNYPISARAVTKAATGGGGEGGGSRFMAWTQLGDCLGQHTCRHAREHALSWRLPPVKVSGI